MDEMHEQVLRAFYPDRFLTFEQIVERTRKSLPFVRESINRFHTPEGNVEEIIVPKRGQKHNYFRLTDKGKHEAARIQAKWERIDTTYNALVASGVDPVEAATRAALESIKTDNSTIC